MFIYIPFLCVTLGAVISWRGLPPRVLRVSDMIMNTALMLLMTVIGLNIGLSETVMKNLGRIGIKCLLISLAAIACSVALTALCEKTVMPLEKIRLTLLREKQEAARQNRDAGRGALPRAENAESKQEDATGECGDTKGGIAQQASLLLENAQTEEAQGGSFSPLLILMPLFILLGILIGYFALPKGDAAWLDTLLTISLIFLYTGAGIILGTNKEVFTYIKKLGLRILFLPLSIFAGCLLGGFLMGVVLDVPLKWSVLSASGMGYYSMSGAFLTEAYGIEAGVYGFIVNVSRDVFTVALLPLLSKISKGSPIASGAGGCMDTMLIPVSKAVGPELGLVALISGTITTLAVPIWLPLGVALFG